MEISIEFRRVKQEMEKLQTVNKQQEERLNSQPDEGMNTQTTQSTTRETQGSGSTTSRGGGGDGGGVSKLFKGLFGSHHSS